MEDLLNRIFAEMPEQFAVKAMETRDIGWECDCSTERLEKALMSIGVTDMKTILEEDGEAELTCQFCRTKYHFDKEHLERLLDEMM